MKLEPIKFKKVFIKKIWGGRNLEKYLNIKLPDNEMIGESWEVSSHKHGMSIIQNGKLKGKTLQEVLNEYKELLVGEKIYKKYKNTFPLLIKYLDINDRLSIQVHPNDEYGLKNHNELGKSESWYVIYASSNAKLIMGMMEGYNKELFLKKAINNDFTNMFKEISVKTGDILDITPGTVHASLDGTIIIAEIQENSDLTYRIYDFDRVENGKKRELHLKRASEVIDFNKKINVLNTEFKNNEYKKLISNTDYYVIEKLKIENKYYDFSDTMIIYSILEGKGKVNNIDICIGETILIPANIEVEISGNLELLRTIPK